MNTDQKLELAKIIVGCLFTIVAGFWTYFIYTQDVRKNEVKTLGILQESIAGMMATCDPEWGPLADLSGGAAGDTTTRSPEKSQCHEFYLTAYRQALSGPVTVTAPLFRKSSWPGYWRKLLNVIASAGYQQFDESAIEEAWNAILVAKRFRSNAQEES